MSEVFRAKIVFLILSQRSEEALEFLGEHYNVRSPSLRVGMPKGHGRHAGCYVSNKRTIFVSDRNNLSNPRIILHEFYHHLRTLNGRHKGTEKYADKFAEEYIRSYELVCLNSDAFK